MAMRAVRALRPGGTVFINSGNIRNPRARANEWILDETVWVINEVAEGLVRIRGKGRRERLAPIGSFAAKALVRFVFEEHGVAELYSSCLVRNQPSFRVLQKTGFRHIGYGLHPHTKWGPEDRFALFELARGEWLESLNRRRQSAEG